MDTITRRRFLIASGVAAVARWPPAPARTRCADILATADDPNRGPDDRTLVVVTLYGGNDGLATVIPFADSAYHDARPGLAYTAEQVLQAGRRDRAEPVAEGAAQALHRQAGSRSCAAWATRSRTAATSGRWTSGRPRTRNGRATTGWLGRWLDGVGGDPRLAVSFEPVLPPLLAGEKQRRGRGAGHRAAACPRGVRGQRDRAGQAVDRRARACRPARPPASTT